MTAEHDLSAAIRPQLLQANEGPLTVGEPPRRSGYQAPGRCDDSRRAERSHRRGVASREPPSKASEIATTTPTRSPESGRTSRLGLQTFTLAQASEAIGVPGELDPASRTECVEAEDVIERLARIPSTPQPV